MKILVFDNYDSFTYNLVHLVEKITHQKPDVYLNDQIDLHKINDYDKIILSPGPGLPSEAGLLIPVIQQYAAFKSILGVCLGHQAIAEAFGGSLLNLDTVYHGVEVPLNITDQHSRLLKGIENGSPVGRYHSWIVNKDDLPENLHITATDKYGYIMAMEHKQFDIQGVQFHPESILTPCGEQIIRNWIDT